MKTFFCKQCKFSGTRGMVRKHLRSEHLIGRKGLGKFRGKFYSIDDKGNKQEYPDVVK